MIIWQAIQRVGVYYCIYPEYSQGRKILWDSIDNGGRRFLDYIPAQLIASTNSQMMQIRMINGSLIQVIGSDNYNSLVGTNPVGIMLSEYALQDPMCYNFLRPILLGNNGFAIFVSTPRGRNHMRDLWDIAEKSDNWFTYHLTVDQTKHIPVEAIEDEIARGEMSRDLALQEYWCFPGDHTVLMADGIKQISDIKTDDLVISHTGRVRKVLDVMSRHYEGEMISITSYGSSEKIICTPEHPLRVYCADTRKYAWVLAKDITKEHQLVYPKMVRGYYGNSIVPFNMVLLIAWYITEGSTTKNTVQFSVKDEDEALGISVLAKSIGYNSSTIKTRTCYQVTINSTQLADFFKVNCGTISYNKKIPFSLIAGNEHQFFGELMKGDGCRTVHKNQVRYTYTTVSKSLAYQVQLLANSLTHESASGISVRKGRKSVIEGREVNCRESYQVLITFSDGKNHKLYRSKYSINAGIRKIEQIPYSGTVYNLKVQYDESYIVHGRAVHNCSWDFGVEGAYYTKYIDKLKLNGQIGDVLWDPNLKVHAAFDLGIRDKTCIVMWQNGRDGSIRIIDSYSNTDVGLEHYAKYLHSKDYNWGKIFAPHDIAVRELGTGLSRLERSRQLGINFIIAPRLSLEDGIEAVRAKLPLMWFDKNKAAPVIKALENYRKEYDSKLKVYKNHPLHDESSHFSDAVRYLALCLPKSQDGLSSEALDKRYREAMGYTGSEPGFFDGQFNQSRGMNGF